jgi:signal transduction histidine kinase
LTNVAKHAQRATAISVVVDRRDRRVRLTIDDNGCGFDVNVFDGQEAGRLGRFGLVGMRERISLLGGTIEIESSLEGGTTIYANIPLHSESAAA